MKHVHIQTYIRKIRQVCVHTYVRKTERRNEKPRFTKNTLREMGFHSSGEFNKAGHKLVLNITIER